jgi:hypothetical protein
MQLTVESVVIAVPIVVTIGGLIWKASSKLTTIESKVDKALEWIAEQKQSTPVKTRRKRVSR